MMSKIDRPTDVPLVAAKLPDGTHLSCHARERMHRRGVTTDQVQGACNHKVSRVKGKASIHEHGNVAVVKAGQKVITTYQTVSKTLRLCSHRKPSAGLLESLQTELCMIVRYDTHGDRIHLKGDPMTIERAKRRLANYLQETSIERAKRLGNNDRFSIRIKFERDVRGIVIGKGGANIKDIERRMGLSRIKVTWDDTTNELVVSPPMLLSPQRQDQLRRLVVNVATQSKT